MPKRTNDFTGKETTANPNPSNNFTVTLSACWVKNTPYAYDYTGGEQTFTAPCNGYYKLEVWGAQGAVGKAWKTGYLGTGGYGGYSIGVLSRSSGSKLYINVGGQGKTFLSDSTPAGNEDGCSTYHLNIAAYANCLNQKYGGYNGGAGVAGLGYTSAGAGGATHIATMPGVLSSLEGYKGTLLNNSYYNSYYNSSVILIVAGGGGVFTPCAVGCNTSTSFTVNCPTAASGSANGGGYIGGGVRSFGGRQTLGGIASGDDGTIESTGNGSFGQGTGQHEVSHSSSGGGGGFYGGAGKSNSGAACGGGGSGYIASSNLISVSSITKHMVGYNVPTSLESATRTYSNTNVSATATSDYSKTGNGYAKILYLGPTI